MHAAPALPGRSTPAPARSLRLTPHLSCGSEAIFRGVKVQGPSYECGLQEGLTAYSVGVAPA